MSIRPLFSFGRARRRVGPTVAAERSVTLVRHRPAESSFTPSHPQLSDRLAVGRGLELSRILQALREERAHVVLYAERGRGKTSLANMVVSALRRDSLVVARYTCDASDDFDSIFRGLLRDLPGALSAGRPESDGDGCEAILPRRTLRPNDMIGIPGRLTCRRLVCVIDEFDRVENQSTRTLLADSIKQISDQCVALQMLIVGVSNNLDEILGQHPSIQRTVVGVPLQVLTRQDISDLLERGGRESGFTFPPDIVAQVIHLARGIPHMAQLLGLRLTQAAAEQGASAATMAHLPAVLARVVAEGNPRAVAMYQRLTQDGRNAEMVTALRHLANAPQDKFGRIAIGPTAGDCVELGDQTIPAACWALCLEQGAIEPVGASGVYTFTERWLMHHILVLEVLGQLNPPASLAAATPGEAIALPQRSSLRASHARQDV